MENTMDKLIASVNPAEDASDEARKAAKREQNKEQNQALIDCMKDRISKNPDFLATVKTMSGNLEVVHTMTFSDKGGLVLNKEASLAANSRTLKAVPAIVGYEIKNVGTTPIAYKTATCTKGADGMFVEEPCDAVLQPGDTAFVTRQYMTMLAAAPEFSFELANGKIVKGSGGTKTGKTVRSKLEAYYFSFDKETGLSVNDDAVVIPVGEQLEDGKWVVKPQFEAVFGFLNNPKKAGPKGTRSRKPSEKIDRPTLLANFVYTAVLGNE